MGYLTSILILGCINIVVVLGLSVLTGYTGLFSIGHAGFMAVGGYAAAIIYIRLHVPFALALPLGGVAAGLSSYIIGYPAFRGKLRGDYFAIATLGFAEAVRLLLNTTYPVIGGAYGLMGIPQKTNLPIALAVALLAFAGAQSFVRSQHGKNCVAVYDDETAAQMMGVDLLRTKLMALFISAFYAGVAGALYAFYMAYLSPSMFGISKSSDLLAAVVFGGMQSIIGPVIIAFVTVALPELLRFLLAWRLVIYGLLFVVMMVFRPQGLLGYRELDFGPGWRRATAAVASRLGKPRPPRGPQGPVEGTP
jgi:branched-chain amino acid transport system permease protein